MVPQSGSQGFMEPEQRHILLLLLEIYNAITLVLQRDFIMVSLASLEHMERPDDATDRNGPFDGPSPP